MTEAKGKLIGKAKVVWVSTRRGISVADGIASNLVGRYLLHDVLSNEGAPLHEFSEANLVVFEVPPITKPQFEHKFLDVVQQIRALGPDVLVVVQPSLRRKSNKTLWISKWNYLQHAPFKFRQTCSCKTGNGAAGCHLVCYVGCSKAIFTTPCDEVPTLCATSKAAADSLSGTILYLIASMHLAVKAATAPTLCRPIDTIWSRGSSDTRLSSHTGD